MHMIKLFKVDPHRPDELLPFYSYHANNKQSIAKVGQRKRWNNFGKGSRNHFGELEHSRQYEVGRSNEPVDFYAKHKGVSGLHTPDPSFSLYSVENILQAINKTAEENDHNGDLTINDRLLEEGIPNDYFHTVFYNIDRSIRKRTDDKVGLQDIYNLAENSDTAKTGRLVIPQEYKSAFKESIYDAIDSFYDEANESEDFSKLSSNIILPHGKDYYYTNGKKPGDYYNLLDMIYVMGEGSDNDNFRKYRSVPYLVDVGDSVFNRNDRYNQTLSAQVDHSAEMVARSMTPKNSVSMNDIDAAVWDVLRYYNTLEDRDKAAQEHFGRLYDIDPIEISDEKYKSILNDMSEDYFSDWLKFLNRGTNYECY